MPQCDRSAYLAYQAAYYQRRKRTLQKRARLRQRLQRGTVTLWAFLPEPQGFCAAMAQKALNEYAGAVPDDCKAELIQEIAEALVQGKPASRCRNPLQYAARLAMRVAKHSLRRMERYAVSSQE